MSTSQEWAKSMPTELAIEIMTAGNYLHQFHRSFPSFIYSSVLIFLKRKSSLESLTVTSHPSICSRGRLKLNHISVFWCVSSSHHVWLFSNLYCSSCPTQVNNETAPDYPHYASGGSSPSREVQEIMLPLTSSQCYFPKAKPPWVVSYLFQTAHFFLVYFQ